MSKNKAKKNLNRRDFIKGAGILSAFAFASPLLTDPLQQALTNVWVDDPHGTGDFTQDYTAKDVIYTTCEQCNTHCTIKTFIMDAKKGQPYSSLVRKIAGNPYSPLSMVPFKHLDYATTVTTAALGFGSVALDGRGFRGGRTCLKGQAGIQTVYDAQRITKPLKRVGSRGSGKWVSVSWEEAINDIVNGSSDLGTPGLKDIWAYVPEKEVMADWERVQNNQMTFEDFDKKYTKLLIDTKHPDFGPKANQIGTLAGHRRDFVGERIWIQGFGSVNLEHHGGICGLSHVTGNVRSFNPPKKVKKRMYVDTDHVEFLISWGTNPLISNKGPTWLAPRITNALERGMKMAVVDTRMSETAEKAHMWIPIQPGADGALALAMGRWIVENKRYDERYLRNPNQAAAKADGEPTWSDATHLINVGDNKRPKVRAADLGLGDKEFIVMENGVPVPFNKAQDGELEVDTLINGIHVKSVFTLYKERVMEKSFEEYAQITGVPEEQIVALAKEFTSHGKRAAIISYRGIAMHTNGYYNTRAINILNHLIGNYDWKGGSISSGAKYQDFAGKLNILKVPNGHQAWGIPLSRQKAVYEKSTLFKRDGGYPALRPWFPYAGSASHEFLPSAAEGYPYPLKALFIQRMSPILSMPGGHGLADILKDPEKIPLLVASDVTIGESSMYADYLLPDLTYLERFGRESIYPNQLHKVTSIMQPVTRVVPEARATEDIYIDILKKMSLPGVGKNAFEDGSSLDSYEDFYLKMVVNIAYDGDPVPDASSEEMTVFEESRKKALGSYFNIEKWKQAVKPEEWSKVVYVLNRGGRFEAPGNEYIGEYIKYQYADQVNFYDEGVAKGKHSFTGQFFDGLPKIEEIINYEGDVVKSSLPLKLINWKAANIGTHRNISSAWLREVKPSNSLWMNPVDAAKRGLKNGDQIKIKSSTSELLGVVFVTNGIRPGTVGAEYNFGHSAYGSTPVQVDGYWTKTPAPYGNTKYNFFEPAHEESGYALGRDTGFSINSLLELDPVLKSNGYVDLIGGSASQYDSRVDVVKA